LSIRKAFYITQKSFWFSLRAKRSQLWHKISEWNSSLLEDRETAKYMFIHGLRTMKMRLCDSKCELGEMVYL